jgi:hypothetical protein
MSIPKEEIHKMVDALPQEKILILKNFLDNLLKINNEDKIWLETDLGALPPYEWGPDGVPKGKPVDYKPNIGLVVKEGK